MATVMHYIDQWLAESQGFVDALVSRSRHRPVVVSRAQPANRATFSAQHVVSLGRWLPLLERGPKSTQRLNLATGALARYLRADLVHVHFGYHVRDVLSLARRGIPVVVSLHGHDVTAVPRQHPGFYSHVFDRVSAVVVPSVFLAEQAVMIGVPEGKVRVIPSGIDTSFFHAAPFPEGPPAALFVGRLVEKKGLDVLLEAWPAILSRVPAARLKVIGAGPLEEALRSPPPGVVYEPPDPSAPSRQVRRAIEMAHVVITPSRTASNGDSESLLIVNLEAQASGRPVVSTNHGGVPEFVQDGRTGVLVPEGDASALADGVVTLLADLALAAKLGAAGPGWCTRFDVEDCARRVDDLYDELLGTSGADPRRMRVGA